MCTSRTDTPPAQRPPTQDPHPQSSPLSPLPTQTTTAAAEKFPVPTQTMLTRVWQDPRSGFQRRNNGAADFLPGHKQLQSLWHNRKFHRKGAQRVSIPLRVNRIRIQRLAHQRIRLPEMHILFL